MAKYYSSTFGKISGKHGTAVAVIMKNGTTYLREYVKPSNPRTDKQQAHRAKFALSSKALVPFNPIFKDTMGITNGISKARSHAFNNAIVGEYPSFSMDYESLMFSFGTLEKMQNSSFASNEGVMDIKWDFNKMYNCHGNDRVNLVVFNKDANQAIHLKDVASRSDRNAKIDIHDAWHDSELYMWAYATRGDMISDSVFVGKLGSVGIGECVHPEEEKSIDSPILSDVFQSVMAFVIMVCNLIGLFREVVIVTNIQNSLNTLIYRVSSVLEYIENSFKERVLSLTLQSYRVVVFERLWLKYQSLISPVMKSFYFKRNIYIHHVSISSSYKTI